METKRFSRNEFDDLFKRASARCLENFVHHSSAGPVPGNTLYTVSAFNTDLLTRDQALSHLLRDDGSFRPSIRLSPVAQTESETVIDIAWGDDAMDPGEWTDTLPPATLRFAFEPFVIMSPVGDAFEPRFTLPFYRKS